MLLIDYLYTLISYFKQPRKRKWIKLSKSLSNKIGLEIGGPSNFFSLGGYFPVYLFGKQIDVVNFSTDTVWEGSIKEGMNYHYYKKKSGYQYIAEATDLNKVNDQKYDFVLSCHSLEHVANPLKALFEWKRIMKSKGIIMLVLPFKENTFDINRPFTNFYHLLEDYKNGIDESDTTHFEEIIKLHEVGRDSGFVSAEAFKERLQNNLTNRCAHHHVFSNSVVKEMLEHVGFTVIEQEIVPPFHLVTYAQLTV